MNKRKKIFIVIALAFLFVGFLSTWLDRASTFRSDGEETITLSDKRTHNQTQKYTITNYVPWYIGYNIQIMYLEITNDDPHGRIPTNTDFAKYDFTIATLYKESYGDTLNFPKKQDNKKPVNYDEIYFHSGVLVKPFTKLTLTYTYSWTEALNETVYFSIQYRGKTDSTITKYILDYPYPLNIIIPMILFIITGYFMLPTIVDHYTSIIKDSYSYIYHYNQNNKYTQKRNLKTELDTFRDASNLITIGIGVLLAPSITIIKQFFRSKVMEHKFTGPNKTEYDDYLDNKYTNPATSLLEFKTIAWIVGFIVSLGVTFSWNLGAISPLIFSAGLLVICVNLGYAYFIADQTESRKFIFSLIGLIILILLGEQELWRRLSSMITFNH